MSPLAWMLLGTGWAVAIWAVLLSRRLARQVRDLTQMYWEVKYECGELRARLQALSPESVEGAAPARPPGQTFVALSDVRRKPTTP